MADAQFVIDIAAEMPSGPATAAELERLTEGLLGAGKDAEFFGDAIARTSRALDIAKASSDAANAALAAGQAEYANLERAALQASKAAEKAGAKNAGVVPPEMQAALDAAQSKVNTYVATLRKLEGESKTAKAEQDNLAKTLKNIGTLQAHTNKTIASQAEQFEKLGGGIAAIGGPFGQLGQAIIRPLQGFSKLNATLGETKAISLVAGVGVAALAAALLAAASAAVIWGVKLADANREARLNQEAAEALDADLIGLRDTYGAITRATGLLAPELNTLRKSLKEAKVSAEDMPEALEAVALAERALGKEGSQEFIAGIKKGDRAVRDLAKDTKAALGGVVAKQMLGLDAQTDTLKRGFGEIFGSLDIEPVLAGFNTLVKMFDSSTEIGGTLKFLFQEIFQPVIDLAPKAAQLFEAFIIQVLILGLKAYLFFREWRTEIEMVGVAIGIAGALFLAALFPIEAAVLAVVYAFTHWSQITEFLTGLIATVSEFGSAIVTGIAQGIANGATAVYDALAGVVSGAINGAKKLLGIASPSKVFMGIGDNTAEGFASGVAGNDNATAAVEAMATPPPEALRQAQLSGDATAVQAMSGGAAPSAAATGGGGKGVDLGSGNTFNFYGVKDAENAKDLFEEMLTKVLEGDAASLGAEKAA